MEQRFTFSKNNKLHIPRRMLSPLMKMWTKCRLITVMVVLVLFQAFFSPQVLASEAEIPLAVGLRPILSSLATPTPASIPIFACNGCRCIKNGECCTCGTTNCRRCVTYFSQSVPFSGFLNKALAYLLDLKYLLRGVFGGSSSVTAQ